VQYWNSPEDAFSTLGRTTGGAELRKTNRQRWIYHTASEFSSAVGIRTPEVKIIGIDKDAKEYGACGKRYLACANQEKHVMVIRPRGYSLPRLRHTIVHEVIHFAFPRLQHGVRFEQYAEALLRGHMAFGGNGLITDVVKPEPPIDAKVAELIARRKKWQTKLKRAHTAIKKLERKIQRLEKMREEEAGALALVSEANKAPLRASHPERHVQQRTPPLCEPEEVLPT
jgi:hypothetical protein